MTDDSAEIPWYKELNRYHWFVFIVAALGWLFDTMDQQLFNLARRPAMTELLVREDVPNLEQTFNDKDFDPKLNATELAQAKTALAKKKNDDAFSAKVSEY